MQELNQVVLSFADVRGDAVLRHARQFIAGWLVPWNGTGENPLIVSTLCLSHIVNTMDVDKWRLASWDKPRSSLNICSCRRNWTAEKDCEICPSRGRGYQRSKITKAVLASSKSLSVSRLGLQDLHAQLAAGQSLGGRSEAFWGLLTRCEK
jgi:hypothetical protein